MNTAPVANRGGRMGTVLERLLLEVAAILLQLAVLQIVRWVRRRPAVLGAIVAI